MLPALDGVTAADYEVNLEANLLDLLEHASSPDAIGRRRSAGRKNPKSGRLAKDARHSDMAGITHLMQLVFGDAWLEMCPSWRPRYPEKLVGFIID